MSSVWKWKVQYSRNVSYKLFMQLIQSIMFCTNKIKPTILFLSLKTILPLYTQPPVWFWTNVEPTISRNLVDVFYCKCLRQSIQPWLTVQTIICLGTKNQLNLAHPTFRLTLSQKMLNGQGLSDPIVGYLYLSNFGCIWILKVGLTLFAYVYIWKLSRQ